MERLEVPSNRTPILTSNNAEDCQVCCRPITVSVSIVESDRTIVNVNAEDEA